MHGRAVEVNLQGYMGLAIALLRWTFQNHSHGSGGHVFLFLSALRVRIADGLVRCAEAQFCGFSGPSMIVCMEPWDIDSNVAEDGGLADYGAIREVLRTPYGRWTEYCHLYTYTAHGCGWVWAALLLLEYPYLYTVEET